MLHKSMQTTWTASRQGGGGAASPVRGVIGGAAFHLAEQGLLAVQVEKSRCHRSASTVYYPVLIDGEPGPAAAVLIDAQVRHRRRILVQHGIGSSRERRVRGQPGDPGVPGRLRRGDPAPGDLPGSLLPQPGRDPAPRRQLRHPLGERLTRALAVGALAPQLDPAQVAPRHRPGARPAAGSPPSRAPGPRPCRTPGTSWRPRSPWPPTPRCRRPERPPRR